MCGIVGMLSRFSNGFWKTHMDMFTTMLRADSIRGPDSTGVFGVTRGNSVDILKGDTDGYMFTRTTDYTKFERKINSAYHIVIGHNRKATIGSIKPENAHPFRSSNIILVHNGSLRNAEKIDKSVEVDSAAIASALAEHNADKALSLLDGPFALVWYDTTLRTLNLARNRERPLVLLKTTDTWIISSEAGLPYWLLGRENKKPDTLEEVPVGKIWTFPLDKLDERPIESTFNEFKWESPTRIPVYTGYYHPHHQPYTPSGTSLVDQNLLPSVTHTDDDDETDVNTKPISKIPSTGTMIAVRFDDSKDDETGCTTFIGHPILDGVMDENIIVKLTKKDIGSANAFTRQLAQNELFNARITAVGVYRGVPIIYVDAEEPVKAMFRSLNGQYFAPAELETILKQRCSRCSWDMFPHQVEKAIIRKKKGASRWEILCEKCVQKSVSERRNMGEQAPAADAALVVQGSTSVN